MYGLILRELRVYDKMAIRGDSMVSSQELKMIIDNSSDGIFVTDGQGKVLILNQACKKFLGIEDENYILGKNVDVLEKEGIISSSAIVDSLRKKQKVTLFQATRTGQKIIVTANPVFDAAGNITKVISNSRDVTEFLALKEQFAKEKELAEFYKRQLEQRKKLNDLVYQSPAMRKLVAMAAKVAEYDTTLLLTGESGVGKNEIAKLIHQLSNRAAAPFIQINCGAIPLNLLESELFGYAKGAFTGANKDGDIGKLELANNGTLLFDEVAELPLQQQAKLLQIINEGTFMRVGGKELIRVNLRIISATNKNLEALVRSGEFREDLYYRLNVINLKIPPLRERKEDIPRLIKHYLDHFNEKYGIEKSLSNQALRILESYPWPGNVRELKNLVEQMMILSENDIIDRQDIPEHLQGEMTKLWMDESLNQHSSLAELMDDVERQIFNRLHHKNYSSYKIAELLKISQSTAMRKIKKYLSPPPC
ncbi:MAG: sigma 54-interacting transcriptional regulator [Clostridiales bacterium]